MIRRPLPRYTNMLRQRIYAYFDRDDNRAALNGRVLAALIVVFLGMALVTPLAALASYLFGDPATTPTAIGKEFLYALVREVLRAWLAVTAFTAVLGSGILALHAIYGLSAEDARARILTAFNLTNPVLISARDGKMEPKDKEKASNLAGGPFILRVAANTAVVTEKNGRQRRVLGAGVHLLEKFERILAAVDLRAQAAKRETCAQTKDGIPIRATGEVEFRLRGGSPRLSAGLPFGDVVRFARQEWVIAYYRFRKMTARAQELHKKLDEQAARTLAFTTLEKKPAAYVMDDRMVVRAVYSQTLSRDPSGAVRPNTWTETVTQMVMAKLGEVLGELTLDRITEPEDAPPDQTLKIEDTPRSEIQREVTTRIQSPAAEQGCIPVRFSLGNVALDSTRVDADLNRRVEDQRHATWSAQWTQRAKLAHSNSAAESSRRNEEERARLQAKAIREMLAFLLDETDETRMREMLVVNEHQYVKSILGDPRAPRWYKPGVIAVLNRLNDLIK